MSLPLVEHLRFARSQFLTGLEGVNADEAERRFQPINSISWLVGHLAAFDQFVWLRMAQGKEISQAVKACAFGKPASTPPYHEMVAAFEEITAACDLYLDQLTEDQLGLYYEFNGKRAFENVGTFLQRQAWHYWYHLGEAQAIRQLLGHGDLYPFVGDIPPHAAYRANAAKALVTAMVDGLNNHEIEPLGFLEQAGYDVAKVLKFVGAQGPAFFAAYDDQA